MGPCARGPRRRTDPGATPGGPERSPADLSPVEVDESLEHTPAELAGVAREHAWARGR
jgi:hypothetical protein